MERWNSSRCRGHRLGDCTKEIGRTEASLLKQLERTHILARIIEAKQKRLQVAKMRVPEPIVKRMAGTAKPVPSFREALQQSKRIRIIAEVKKASPSKGVLKADLDAANQATAYHEAGACA